MSALKSRSIFPHSTEPTSAALSEYAFRNNLLPVKSSCTIGIALIEDSKTLAEEVPQCFGIEIDYCLVNSCVAAVFQGGLNELARKLSGFEVLRSLVSDRRCIIRDLITSILHGRRFP